MSRFHKIIRIIWVSFGLLFILWMANSYCVRGFDPEVLENSRAVTVEKTNHYLQFRPTGIQQPTGFIFFPGALVAPEAYAPMARALAEDGFNTFIIKLPFGSAPLASQQASVMDQALEIEKSNSTLRYWVVGGHSRGGAIAARFAYQYDQHLDGLILIGTSHPKEDAFDLSERSLMVTKIYATNDGLASEEEVEATSQYLPTDTQWVRIEGGNHAQFGYYGTQLGDHKATISRPRQQELMLDAILYNFKLIQGEGVG